MILEEFIEFLKKVPPFQFLDEGTLKNIAGNVSMEFHPQGTTILSQGGPAPDSLYIIKKGVVKVSIKNAEEEVFVDYRGEGDLIGYLLIFEGATSRATVSTVDDTIFYLVKRDTIKNLLYTNPKVREFFHKSFLAKYLDRTFKEIENRNLSYSCGDRILFTIRVGELAAKEVITASQDLSIQDAAEIMSVKRISCLILVDNENIPAGIVTDRDLRDKVVSKGKDLSTPVNEIMSVPHVRADAREYCFEAILRMVQHNVHHLLVMKDGKLTGILTNHDLMLLQGTSPLSIVKDIESQDSVEKLVPVSGKIDNIIGLLLNEGAKASNITRIITEINDRLIRKITEFAEAQTGPPPVSYCWVVFGSEGRKEQTFKMDQDNALIYADPGSPEQARHAEEYFEKFTLAARDGLIKCGFPACASDFMATNPLLRKSLSDWKRFFSSCIISPPADAPLNPASFMDFRAIYGEAHLLDVLKNHALSLAKDSGKFLRHLADLSIRNIPPIGLLKALVVEKSGEHKDNLDLKSKCMSPLVDIIRLFALEERITETSTIERIHILSERHTIVSENADELLHAFDFLLLIGIQHQFLQFQEGAFIDSMINPDNLTNLEKRIAKETFQLISKLQDLVSQHYKLSHI